MNEELNRKLAEWLLTNEEIRQLEDEERMAQGIPLGAWLSWLSPERVAQAQDAKSKHELVEWGEARCTEHPQYSDNQNKEYYLSRWDCTVCMKALRREVGLEVKGE